MLVSTLSLERFKIRKKFVQSEIWNFCFHFWKELGKYARVVFFFLQNSGPSRNRSLVYTRDELYRTTKTFQIELRHQIVTLNF